MFIAKLLMTFVLVGSVAAYFGFQWNDSHVFNPEWHPHARFHAVQIGFVLTTIAAASTWLLWKAKVGPRLAIGFSALLPLSFWGGEFIAWTVNGTHPSPDLVHLNTFSLLGWEVYGNLFFSAVMIALTLLAIGIATFAALPRKK